MSATAPHPRYMTADEFIPWAMQQPEGKRYELVAGEVVATAPERVGHARGKLRTARRLSEAVEVAGLPCEVFVDGVSVRVDSHTVYEPDVFLRCGPPLDDDVVETSDPLVVFEVALPSTHKYDAGGKLAGYTSRHKLWPLRVRNAVWYPIDFARSRHTNPARIPVIPLGRRDDFRLASVRRYLIVNPRDRVIIHHRRDDDGRIDTSVLHDDTLTLDPPGVTITSLFGP